MTETKLGPIEFTNGGDLTLKASFKDAPGFITTLINQEYTENTLYYHIKFSVENSIIKYWFHYTSVTGKMPAEI